jgi:hypothetical protein
VRKITERGWPARFAGSAFAICSSLYAERDHLRVAAALEVEDAVVAPPVLVVADQRPLGVGRERRLPRPGEAEEDRDVVVVADVRGAVHREDARERKPVVHQREDRLLDLARVERAADQHLLPRRVQDDERPRARPVRLRVGLEAGRVQHERVGLEAAQLVLGRVDEHRPREERVVRAGRDDADGDALLRVGARERVDDVDVAAAEVRRHLLAQTLEVLLRDLRVDVAPPDPLLRARLTDDELVLRRAARVLARVDRERAALGDAGIAARERVLVQLRRRRVPVDGAGGFDPVDRETRA